MAGFGLPSKKKHACFQKGLDATERLLCRPVRPSDTDQSLVGRGRLTEPSTPRPRPTRPGLLAPLQRNEETWFQVELNRYEDTPFIAFVNRLAGKKMNFRQNSRIRGPGSQARESGFVFVCASK
jgi:hypothetical protein